MTGLDTLPARVMVGAFPGVFSWVWGGLGWSFRGVCFFLSMSEVGERALGQGELRGDASCEGSSAALLSGVYG